MKLFLLCFAQTVLYTLGVVVACGLAVEICYRLCFLLMGRRSSRLLWLVTSLIGTPVHEGGHALMCLLFAHRIETVRLFPTKHGGAVVEHSYRKRNPYAAFGNLWIGLGPIISGLGVMLAILFFVYPETLRAFGETITAPTLSEVGEIPVLRMMRELLRGLLTEQTRPVWLRLLALPVLFSLAIHIRLSAADVRGMAPGLPGFALLAGIVSLVVVLMGEGATEVLRDWLQRAAWFILSLFCLILLFAAVQLLLVALICLGRAFLRAVGYAVQDSAEHP